MAVAVSHSSASSKLPSPIHCVQDSLFHQAKFAFTHQPFSTSNTLESEAYRGELSLLRQKSNQLEQIIEVMPTGMIMLDGDGIVIKTNKIASLLLDEPILGQAWFDVIKRSFKPRADDWHEVSLKDGRRVKLEITALGDQPGQLIMITDLTETRLLQDKLGHMQRLSSLGRLVSKLAHQIRTPLSAAMLYGANLKNKKLSPIDRSSFQDKLMSRLHDLEQQVNDMLLFSKSGKQQVVEPLSINKLISDSVNRVEALVTQAKAKVTLSLCGDDCEILGNKRALSGAIENLIHNSLQVIRHDAEITITTYCQNDYAYISVKDNGQGIDKDLASKIFEPFYTSRAQGTGLGLAVVKSVANAHQGDVRLVSQPGEGAHFCIHLPILETNHVNKESTNESK
jgi:two-component system sensor histidine kinase FlrB